VAQFERQKARGRWGRLLELWNRQRRQRNRLSLHVQSRDPDRRLGDRSGGLAKAIAQHHGRVAFARPAVKRQAVDYVVGHYATSRRRACRGVVSIAAFSITARRRTRRRR